MPDDKKKTGAPDRSRVSANERGEVAYVAKKSDMPAKLVQNVIKQVGPTRTAVMNKLTEMKRNGKK